jgi:hypothetical protein
LNLSAAWISARSATDRATKRVRVVRETFIVLHSFLDDFMKRIISLDDAPLNGCCVPCCPSFVDGANRNDEGGALRW